MQYPGPYSSFSQVPTWNPWKVLKIGVSNPSRQLLTLRLKSKPKSSAPKPNSLNHLINQSPYSSNFPCNPPPLPNLTIFQPRKSLNLASFKTEKSQLQHSINKSLKSNIKKFSSQSKYLSNTRNRSFRSKSLNKTVSTNCQTAGKNDNEKFSSIETENPGPWDLPPSFYDFEGPNLQSFAIFTSLDSTS
jgi:hypothetical protein